MSLIHYVFNLGAHGEPEIVAKIIGQPKREIIVDD